jgi:membrane fusion protein (multidrug efflux system)
VTTALLVVDGKVEQRELTVDRAVGNQWWVTAGLKAGDQLIVEGGQKVRAGAAVQVQDANAPAVTPSTPVKEG